MKTQITVRSAVCEQNREQQKAKRSEGQGAPFLERLESRESADYSAEYVPCAARLGNEKIHRNSQKILFLERPENAQIADCSADCVPCAERSGSSKTLFFVGPCGRPALSESPENADCSADCVPWAKRAESRKICPQSAQATPKSQIAVRGAARGTHPVLTSRRPKILSIVSPKGSVLLYIYIVLRHPLGPTSV